MIDFLKAHPFVTRDEYLWTWTVPQILLASYDSTHVEYLTEEQAKIEKGRKHAVHSGNIAQFANDLGIPIFKQ